MGSGHPHKLWGNAIMKINSVGGYYPASSRLREINLARVISFCCEFPYLCGVFWFIRSYSLVQSSILLGTAKEESESKKEVWYVQNVLKNFICSLFLLRKAHLSHSIFLHPRHYSTYSIININDNKLNTNT